MLNLVMMDSTKIHGTGTLTIKLNTDKMTAVLKDTLFIPNLRSCILLSMAKVTDYGYKVVFIKNSATIMSAKNEKIRSNAWRIYMLSKA